MSEYKYMATNGWERIVFCMTKEEAERAALEMMDCTDDMIYIYEVKHVGSAFIPEPDPVVEWAED